MKHMKWITCGWPGLSRLWLEGQWTGLAVAAGFGIIFNAAIIVQLKLAGQVHENLQTAGWLLTLAFWIVGGLDGIIVTTHFRRQQKLGQQRHSEIVDTTNTSARNATDLAKSDDLQKLEDSSATTLEINTESLQTLTDDLFIKARNQYLKGNWLQCEILLESALEDYPGDLESRLLLISLLRVTKRYEEALVEITQFQQWDGAEKWSFEISREVGLLDGILSGLEDSEPIQAA
ncbi:MAG: hypothetical protein VX776_07065 [Planctomycetota bacterium]|nr:hypothetical protein [Planctomycetota bacterium]